MNSNKFSNLYINSDNSDDESQINKSDSLKKAHIIEKNVLHFSSEKLIDDNDDKYTFIGNELVIKDINNNGCEKKDEKQILNDDEIFCKPKKINNTLNFDILDDIAGEEYKIPTNNAINNDNNDNNDDWSKPITKKYNYKRDDYKKQESNGASKFRDTNTNGEVKSKWNDVKNKKYVDCVPDNFMIRDLKNELVIPFGKTNEHMKNQNKGNYNDYQKKGNRDNNNEKTWIRKAQKLLYDCGSLKNHEKLKNIRELTQEYYDCYNNNLYSLDQLKKYIICMYVHMLVKSDNNALLMKTMEMLSEECKKKHDDFNALRKFVVNSIWNDYSLIYNAAYYLSSECIDNIIVWGADLNKLNRDGETILTTIENGYQNKVNHEPKNKIHYARSKEECLKKIQIQSDRIKNNTIININNATIYNDIKDIPSQDAFKYYIKFFDKNFDILPELFKAYDNYFVNQINCTENILLDWLQRACDSANVVECSIKIFRLASELLKNDLLKQHVIKTFDEDTLSYFDEVMVNDQCEYYNSIKNMINVQN